MRLSTCIRQFFNPYLSELKGVSHHTIRAYRDTFALFLPFAAHSLSIKIDSIGIEHLSSELILAFLAYSEKERNNTPTTRNLRLAAFKSMAVMIRLMHPDQRKIAETIMSIPKKRTQKPLMGFISSEEMMKVFTTVDVRKKEGFRDYTLLHLLYDSGARASEAACLELDGFDPKNSTLAILGKGNRLRRIELWPKTKQLLTRYIKKYRTRPKPLYQHRIFINQRREEFTRHGIHRICKKYLSEALPPKRLRELHPAHSFRHSCAVNMLSSGSSVTDIKNHLGHQNIQSTMVYLHLSLSRKREIQEKL